MATDAARKSKAFKALHDGDRLFVMPNPWDLGTVRMLEASGFKALATTSAGFAFSIGRRDWPGEVTRQEALRHARTIVRSTALPVSADLENGYGDTPEDMVKTVQLAARAGLAGCSIEDTTGDPGSPIYPFSQALERISAAAEAAGRLARPFILTARAENFLHGKPDLDDTLQRLIAFEAAGADVLYAPGLNTIDQIREVCTILQKPVNVVMGLKGTTFSLQELEESGVRRVSLGSSLARAAIGAFLRAVREVNNEGTFSFAADAAGFGEIEDLLMPGTRE